MEEPILVRKMTLAFLPVSSFLSRIHSPDVLSLSPSFACFRSHLDFHAKFLVVLSLLISHYDCKRQLSEEDRQHLVIIMAEWFELADPLGVCHHTLRTTVLNSLNMPQSLCYSL